MTQVICNNCGNVWQEKSGKRMPARCPQCGGINTDSAAQGKVLKNTEPLKGRRWIR